MRDLLKLIAVGVMIFFAIPVNAENYKVLVIPDNILTQNTAYEAFIYDASAEFFADETASILNGTDFISAQPVSRTRELINKNVYTVNAAKNLTEKFKKTYNIDYTDLKKVANAAGGRYVLLLTSYIDSENYILRRTVWDFLNIPGASVIDPAYKISTYAVLVDTNTNKKLWSDTYYKTISVVENRIITRGFDTQAQQLEKIKDYSRYLCPQIARSVQVTLLPPSLYAKESAQIRYDMGNIDNVFTKKYRHLGKEYNKVYAQRKADAEVFAEDTRIKFNEKKQQFKEANEARKAENLKKQAAKRAAQEKLRLEKLEVKAEPVINNTPQTVENSGINEISNKVKTKSESVKNAVFKKKSEPQKVIKSEPQKDIKIEPVKTEQPVKLNLPKSDLQNSSPFNYYENADVLDTIDLKRKKKNNFYGDYEPSRPDLRDYYN